MQRVLYICKWLFVIVITVLLLSFTNEKQSQQQFRLNIVDIQELPEQRFLTLDFINSFLYKNGISSDGVNDNFSSLADLEMSLKSHENVREVEVFTSLNGDVNVNFKQKRPIVRVQSNNNRFYIDELGVSMPLSNNYTARVPIATGDFFEEDFTKLFELADFIDKDDLWKAQIVQIHFSENNQVVLVPRVGSHTITFGSIDSIEEKFDKLRLFYSRGLATKGWHYYVDINLKYKDQVVCTKNSQNG